MKLSLPSICHVSLLRYLTLAFIGFANALPIPLTGTVLSAWLLEAGFEKDVIGFFALLSLPLSFKLLWSPVVDHIPLSFLSLQPRKGWMLAALLGMSLCLFGFGCVDPASHPWLLAAILFVFSLFTGCLYIVGLAYELESIEEESYGMGSAYVIAGYRVGLLCAGGGALYLALIWNWSWMFFAMGALLILGSLMILFQPEPYKSASFLDKKRQQFSQHHSIWKGFWKEIILQPCIDLFRRGNCFVILFLVLTFKTGDQIAKSMELPFYLSLGFDKGEIAQAAKVWGMMATFLGAFLVGAYFRKRDPFLTVIYAGIIHSASLLCHIALAFVGKSLPGLYLIVAIENFTGGIAMTAFIAFLWKVADKRYAAIQYALLWSLFSFKANLLASVGGVLAMHYEWTAFFLIVSLFGISCALVAWGVITKTLAERKKTAETVHVHGAGWNA